MNCHYDCPGCQTCDPAEECQGCGSVVHGMVEKLCLTCRKYAEQDYVFDKAKGRYVHIRVFYNDGV